MTAQTHMLDELRPVAFGIAYRMTGSVATAEDIAQEALLRLHRALEAEERVESPRAYVSTVATRLAIDELRSARARRESYVGDWLPEPLITSEAEDPARHVETADSLSTAFLLLLERLSPEQRAVFLLREVFDYPYDEIARVVGKSEEATRQIAVRARRHVDAERPRFEVSRQRRDELAGRFFAAMERGDMQQLEELLADDVVLRGDGGGKVPALARALFGRRRVSRTLGAWARVAGRLGDGWLERVEVNGQPGAVTRDPAGRVISVVTLDIADGYIQAVSSVVNPEKLGHVGPVADVRAVLRGEVTPDPT